MFYAGEKKTGIISFTVNRDDIVLEEGMVLVWSDEDLSISDTLISRNEEGEYVLVERVPTNEEVAANLELEREFMLTVAGNKVSQYTDVVEFYPENTSAEALLLKWRKYRADLMMLTVTADVVWPEKPEA